MLVHEHAPIVGNVMSVIFTEHTECFLCLNCNIVSVFRCSKVEQVIPRASFLSSRPRLPFLLERDKGLPSLQRACLRENLYDFSSGIGY